jgi:hypothetical protein
MVLAATVVVRAGGLIELVGGRTLHVELSRWEDRELGDDVERAIGYWLAQRPQPDLRIEYVDRPELVGKAQLSLGGRKAELSQSPVREQLQAPLATLLERLGVPPRVFLVATDRSVDRRFVVTVSELLRGLGVERVVEVRAARRQDQGSPMVASGPRDWVLVAAEAGREHLGPLLRARGRKIFMLPPFEGALRRGHPDLWFIAPWNPDLEYFPGRDISSCAAARRLAVGGPFWPVTGLPLWTLAALSEVAEGGQLMPVPLTLVGPANAAPGPVREYRVGPELPRCSQR